MNNLTGKLSRPARIAAVISTVLAILLVVAVLRPSAQTGQDIISADEAFKLAQAGDLVIVDIRTPREWRETGIAEPALQLSMPADVTDDRFQARFNDIKNQNPGKAIAIICATGGRTAWMQAELEKQGLGKTLNISEGMFGNGTGDGWIKRGLPVKPANL